MRENVNIMKKGLSVSYCRVFGLNGGLCFGQTESVQWKLVATLTSAINLIEVDKYFAKVAGEFSDGTFNKTQGGEKV
jgi:hypothetical protein